MRDYNMHMWEEGGNTQATKNVYVHTKKKVSEMPNCCKVKKIHGICVSLSLGLHNAKVNCFMQMHMQSSC